MTGTNEIIKLSFLTNNFKTYDKIEMKVDLKGVDLTSLNVYDENDIDLSISLTSSNGTKIVMPAFYYAEYPINEDYGITSANSTVKDFRFRVSLPESAVWSFTVTLKIKGETVDTLNHHITITEESDSHGYLSVAENNRNFVFDDGTGYTAIGENIAYSTTAVSDRQYAKTTIPLMIESAENGANYTRMMNSPWALSVQSGTAPNDFSGGMIDAYQLDKIFDVWNQYGMYGQFVLYTFNMFSEDASQGAWSSSAYNVANGGYLDSPEKFFTDETAIKDTRAFLRYMVARYGYSTNLLAWELFNEPDAVTGINNISAADVVEWHRIMSDYLTSIDPYNHMITTSTANRPTNADVNDAELKNTLNAQSIFDYASVHFYNYNSQVENLASYQSNYQALYSRPVLFTECGDTSVQLDSDLITFHQQNWVGMMGGGAGTAASWYWDKLHQYDGQTQYGALSTVASRIPWNDTSMTVIKKGSGITVINTNVNAYGYKGSDYAHIWLYDTRYNQANKTAENITNQSITVSLKNGTYNVIWTDTYTGETVSTQTATATNKSLTVTAPTWSKDISVSITKN